jgi:hypothetical protein
MKHCIVTRINFSDLDLLEKYLTITKNVLIPALKSQTEKNFEWLVITNADIYEYLKKELDHPFIPIYGNSRLIEYLLGNNINIQTRHDCDDWMSPDYVNRIQEEYKINHRKYDVFLVQAQPKRSVYGSDKESSISAYHNQRCSMFLSICQRAVKHHIFERRHGQMYEITPNIITLPEGYTKWVIHGNNKSVKK